MIDECNSEPLHIEIDTLCAIPRLLFGIHLGSLLGLQNSVHEEHSRLHVNSGGTFGITEDIRMRLLGRQALVKRDQGSLIICWPLSLRLVLLRGLGCEGICGAVWGRLQPGGLHSMRCLLRDSRCCASALVILFQCV